MSFFVQIVVNLYLFLSGASKFIALTLFGMLGKPLFLSQFTKYKKSYYFNAPALEMHPSRFTIHTLIPIFDTSLLYIIVSDYLPEKELLNRIADGDETAFAMLFKMYVPRLHGFLISKAKTEANAQELIQQTFLRIWLSREKLREVENPNAWIFKVAANECYKFIRSQVVSQKVLSIAGNGYEESDCQESTSHFIQYKELKNDIEVAINSLPEQRKKIYILNRQQGMKIAEIARVLNISPKTVKNTLAASLKTIRTYLNKVGHTFLIFF